MSRHHAAVLSVIGLCLFAQALPAAQKAAPKAKANAAPANAQRTVELFNNVRAALQDDKPVREAEAIEMLPAIHRTQKDKSIVQFAHALFGIKVWSAKTLQARNERAIAGANQGVIDQNLVNWWNETDTALKRGGLPQELIAAGKVYLAEYYHNTDQHAKCQQCLDGYELIEDKTQIHPLFNGLFWTIKGLLAFEEGKEDNLALTRECFERALRERERTGMGPDIAQAHGNLGLIHMRIGDYAAAKRELDEALKLYTEGSPALDRLNERVNRSTVLQGQRDYREALALLGPAENLLKKISPGSQKSQADILIRNNRALVYYLSGDFANAEKELSACRNLLVKQGPVERLAELDANLGWVELTTGRPTKALQTFEKARENLKKDRPGSHRIAEITAYLARAELACGKGDKAGMHLKESLDRRKVEIEQVLRSSLTQRDRLAYVQKLRVHPESIAWPGAFDTWLELADALQVLPRDQYQEVLAWKGVLARYRADPADAQSEAIRREILALPTDPKADPIAVARRLELEQQLERLPLQRPAAPPQSVVTPEDVIAALPAGAVLVDILETRRYRPRNKGVAVTDDREYVAFVVKADGTITRLTLGASEEIDAAVKRLNERVADPSKEHNVQRENLGKLVGTPLRHATEGADPLIIAGDGWLNRVPWCALPGVKEDNWVEEITVATVPFAQSLVSRSKRAPSADAPSWLLVGGVDYGQGPGTFKSLPSSAQEVGRIDAFLTSRYKPASTLPVLQGNAAKRESVVNLLTARPGPRVVHLATHGKFPQPVGGDAFEVLDATKALDSMLVFAGANNPDERASALWTAGEVGTLDLAHVDLMVLAACESGLGHIAAGQGQVGLLGALDQAQVGTVVASLWQVDDDATGRLMDRFYTRHFDKQNPVSAAQALRQAQLDLLGDPKHGDPFFWAAWMLMGKP